MTDAIDRQAAIDALRTCYDTETISMDNGDEYINYSDAVGEIEQLPSAQPERKTGHWVYDPDGMDWNIPAWRCSECGGKNDMIPTTIQYKDGPHRVMNPYNWAGSKYCPNCGEKMEG